MIYHSLVPRPHPAFRHLQYVQDVPESWAGPGNEARFIMGGGGGVSLSEHVLLI